MSENRIRIEEKASNELKGAVSAGLVAYNVDKTGDPDVKDLCLTLRGIDGELVGGLLAEIAWGWLHVFILWVREDARGAGWGARLLGTAEEQAIEAGVSRATLDTFSFQSPGFYEKQGYTVFGTLEDFPPGHTRYYMRKKLQQER
ncbi:MAG: GNAT family N-acetyltransferase [Planctomycetota bacterium]|jgi:ribosomal protein S18 acetylase RimI-like enzyme